MAIFAVHHRSSFGMAEGRNPVRPAISSLDVGSCLTRIIEFRMGSVFARCRKPDMAYFVKYFKMPGMFDPISRYRYSVWRTSSLSYAALSC